MKNELKDYLKNLSRENQQLKLKMQDLNDKYF